MRLSNTGFRPPVHDQVTPYEIPPIGPRPLVEPPLQNDDSQARRAPPAGGGQLPVVHQELPERALEVEEPRVTISSRPSAGRTASGSSACARSRVRTPRASKPP